MKTLIAYASKTGTAKKCAELLKERIDSAELCDLSVENPALSAYDNVIVGCGIRMGMFNKPAKKFIEKNAGVLKTKKFGVFVCCGFPNETEYFSSNFPNGELETAIKAGFGGELEIEKLRGMDKFIAKAVAKDGKPLPKINSQAIEDFVKNFA